MNIQSYAVCVCVCVYVCVYVCVCLCVCVTYVYLTLILLYTIPVVVTLRLPIPFSIPDLHRLQCLPCYTLITIPHYIRVLDLISSHIYRQYPLCLTLTGHGKCHHHPIHQLRPLPDAPPFV